MTIKKLLERNSVPDAVVVSNIFHIIYLIGDFGFSKNERDCFLLFTKSKNFIITSQLYSEDVKNKTKGFEIIDYGTGLFLRKNAKELFNKYKIKTIGIEENNLTVAEYKSLKKFTKVGHIDLSKIRMIKSDEEIENIKLACKIGDDAFKFITKQLKTGITEKEVSIKLELYIKQKSAEISFKPIIAFGKNSSIPHHLSRNTKLKNNNIVLLDFGVKINNYCSDMTRTLFFGKADEKFKKIYQTVLEAQNMAISKITIGTNAKDIDKTARSYIISNGHQTIPHSLGHGIGLDVHETPNISPHSKDKIENGMVFSIEPGIYIENYGGVRIEDLVVIKNNKPQLITHSPRNLIEL